MWKHCGVCEAFDYCWRRLLGGELRGVRGGWRVVVVALRGAGRSGTSLLVGWERSDFLPRAVMIYLVFSVGRSTMCHQEEGVAVRVCKV